MPLITNEKCIKPHAVWPSSQITSSMLCAGYMEGKKPPSGGSPKLTCLLRNPG